MRVAFYFLLPSRQRGITAPSGGRLSQRRLVVLYHSAVWWTSIMADVTRIPPLVTVITWRLVGAKRTIRTNLSRTIRTNLPETIHVNLHRAIRTNLPGAIRASLVHSAQSWFI